MTPILLAVGVALVAAVLLAGAARIRRHLPPPDAPSDHHDEITRQLRLAYEQSVERTAAMNRELERLRRGSRYRDASDGGRNGDT
jgi:hypothetical protein